MNSMPAILLQRVYKILLYQIIHSPTLLERSTQEAIHEKNTEWYIVQ